MFFKWGPRDAVRLTLEELAEWNAQAIRLRGLGAA